MGALLSCGNCIFPALVDGRLDAIEPPSRRAPRMYGGSLERLRRPKNQFIALCKKVGSGAFVHHQCSGPRTTKTGGGAF